jgi:hypothetical protein
MDVSELDNKWNSLRPDTQGTFKSLRLSADCIPELYIGLDANGIRCLILKLPAGHSINFASVIKQNLSIELFKESSWIILKLTNTVYKDLFNDLIISLYNKVKGLREVSEYTKILIDAFYRWNEFFEDSNSNRLSDEALMGIVGEMFYLLWEIQRNDPLKINEILSSWQGPFDKGQDFVFSNRNVEVKTKQENALDVRISSEFQLQAEIGKELSLVVVTVAIDSAGLSITDLTNRIRTLVIERLGDFSILLRAFHQKGLTIINLSDYNHFKVRFLQMIAYDCMHPEFPKITVDTKSPLINTVKYNIRISELGGFIIDRYDIP